MEEFLGFTEEEQLSKNFHRLSRDSGVDADVPLTINVYDVEATCESLNNTSQYKEPISTSKEAVDNKTLEQESLQKEFIEDATRMPDCQNGLIKDITCQAKIAASESENSTNEKTSDINISANNIIQSENKPNIDTSSNSPLLFEDVILCTENIEELQNSNTKVF